MQIRILKEKKLFTNTYHVLIDEVEKYIAKSKVFFRQFIKVKIYASGELQPRYIIKKSWSFIKTFIINTPCPSSYKLVLFPLLMRLSNNKRSDVYEIYLVSNSEYLIKLNEIEIFRWNIQYGIQFESDVILVESEEPEFELFTIFCIALNYGQNLPTGLFTLSVNSGRTIHIANIYKIA